MCASPKMSQLLAVVLGFLVCTSNTFAEKDCSFIHTFLKKYEKLIVSLPFHTTPVFTLCTNDTAVNEYRLAVQAYHNFTDDPACQRYRNTNRMNVYETINGQLTALWASANCESCVNAPNETATFMDLSNDLDLCLTNASRINVSNPCTSCDENYMRVQQYYGMFEKHDTGICFDVEDRMNQTRRRWSGQYNCCKDKQRSMVVFGSVASFACAVPLLFYLVMHLVTVRREAKRLFLLNATSDEDNRTPRPSSSQNRQTAGIGGEATRQPAQSSNASQPPTNNLNIIVSDLISIPDTETSNNALTEERTSRTHNKNEEFQNDNVKLLN
ncbi:uncharacterized protein LOC131213683 [Anopheles bellator]|uniref:uncharacterized protein LOC131213683 n=1 Tax=Anopheles bellator TaxID=139047 RepID=UPI002647070F|nr:uncharacterized protein LOC131213683 [Anopheles bellator]